MFPTSLPRIERGPPAQPVCCPFTPTSSASMCYLVIWATYIGFEPIIHHWWSVQFRIAACVYYSKKLLVVNSTRLVCFYKPLLHLPPRKRRFNKKWTSGLDSNQLSPVFGLQVFYPSFNNFPRIKNGAWGWYFSINNRFADNHSGLPVLFPSFTQWLLQVTLEAFKSHSPKR